MSGRTTKDVRMGNVTVLLNTKDTKDTKVQT